MPPFPFPTRAQLLQSSIRTVQYLAAAHLLWEYGFNVRFTRGPSMLPTLEVTDDVVLVSNLHRYGRGIGVGDLIAFKIPFNQDEAIKRVLGLPGDYVMMDSPESGSDTMIQVPTGHCWVVGDNLPDSRDSRFYGPLPLALIKGKVIAKTWPPSEFKWLENTLKDPEG